MTEVFEEMPLVSVVVPLYNTPEKYFAACMESLLHQTLKEIEVLIVDDGSSDGIEKMADAFSAQDRRVKVFHRENGGVSSARNFGMMRARGKYLTFLDADDRLDVDILREASERAEHDGLDLVCWGVVREYADKSVRHEFSSYLRLDFLYEGEACAGLREAVLDCNAELGAPFGKLIRRDIVIGDGIFFDEELLNYAEDVEWNFRLFAKIRRAVILPRYSHHYVFNPTSLTSFITEQNARCAVLCFQKIRESVSPDSAVMQEQIDYRFLFMLTAISVCGFFHPNNTMRYSEKKRTFKAYVAQEEVKKTLRSPSRKRLSFAQRTVIFCMRHKWCFALRMLASIRYHIRKAA